jgi:hypothetical protein
MGEPLVLVIGEEGDWSADTVAAAVGACGTAVFRVTTFDFPQRMQLSASLDGSAGGWCGTIVTDAGVLPLERVTAVYYRRTRTFDLPAGLSGPEQRAARAQARVGLGGVLASMPTRWVNRPAALADAEFKPSALATYVCRVGDTPGQIRRFGAG